MRTSIKTTSAELHQVFIKAWFSIQTILMLLIVICQISVTIFSHIATCKLVVSSKVRFWVSRGHQKIWIWNSRGKIKFYTMHLLCRQIAKVFSMICCNPQNSRTNTVLDMDKSNLLSHPMSWKENQELKANFRVPRKRSWEALQV